MKPTCSRKFREQLTLNPISFAFWILIIAACSKDNDAQKATAAGSELRTDLFNLVGKCSIPNSYAGARDALAQKLSCIEETQVDSAIQDDLKKSMTLEPYASTIAWQKGQSWNHSSAQSILKLQGQSVSCGSKAETLEDLVHELAFRINVKFSDALNFDEQAARNLLKGVYAVERLGAIYELPKTYEPESNGHYNGVDLSLSTTEQSVINNETKCPESPGSCENVYVLGTLKKKWEEGASIIATGFDFSYRKGEKLLPYGAYRLMIRLLYPDGKTHTFNTREFKLFEAGAAPGAGAASLELCARSQP